MRGNKRFHSSSDHPRRGKGRSFGGSKDNRGDDRDQGRAKRGDRPFGKPFAKRDKPFRSFNRDESRGDKPFARRGKPFRGGEGKSKSNRPEGDREQRGGSQGDRFKKPFARRDKPFRSFRTGEDKPGSDRYKGDRGHREGNHGDRPFKKPFARRDKPFRSFRSGEDDRYKGDREGGEGDRPFKKPFARRDKPFRPFRKSEGEGSHARRDKFGDGERKRPDDRRERKSFVESRVEQQKKGFRQQAEEKSEGDGLIRLNKYISNSGVCSRREADDLITAGLITVNGQSVTELGFKVKPTDDVRYDGKKLKAEKPVYILLNKPKGFITTTDDPQERNTVMQLIQGACKERVYPVGRLDRNTSGLLLLTNDGELTEKLTHPSHNVKKIYKAELDRPLTKNDFQKILEGVRLEEGKAMVDDLAIVSEDGKTVGLEIHIGWNRLVRRIFEALGYQVMKLDRSVYATLDKKELSRGHWRFLREEEVIRLKHFL